MDICFKTVRSLVFPWFSQGFPMVFPWFSHGFPMVSPRSMCFRRPWPSAAFTGRSPREAARSISRPEANGHLFFDFQGMGQVTYEFTHIAIENDPFIVNLPMKNGDFPYSYVCLPEGTYEFTWGNFDIQRSQLWLGVLTPHCWELRRFAQASLQSGEPLPSWLSFKHEFAAGRRNGKWLCPISRGRMCQPLPTPVAGSMLILMITYVYVYVYIHNMYTLYDMCTLIKLCV